MCPRLLQRVTCDCWMFPKRTVVDASGNHLAVVDDDVDIGEFYQETTADFVKRALRSSTEPDVRDNREEMIELINAIAVSSHSSDILQAKGVERCKTSDDYVICAWWLRQE